MIFQKQVKNFFFILIFLLPLFSFAQQNYLLSNLKIEADVFGGKIWKHTPNFHPNTTQIVGGAELRILRQTFGSKDWQSVYGFPLCGVQLSYINFNNEHLGAAFAIAPCIQFNFYQTTTRKFYFGIADGLAYITHKYNAVNDTIDNVIGTSINETTQFRLGGLFNFKNNASLNINLSFSHYSNAKFNTPNLGINVYALHIGYQNFISSSPSNYRTVAALNYTKQIKFYANMGYARGGSFPIGSYKDKYDVIALGIDKRWNYKNRWRIGVWYEYNKGAYINANFYEPMTNAAAVAQKFATTLSDEFILGRLSFGATLGIYLYRGGGDGAVFQSLHINYVLYNFNKEKMNQIYCGVQMKSYFGVAEYFETYVGCRL
jgi:Lipid A 3-O-deacylase (PagL)